tara:strand:- start:3047 stop:3682 length:636 start_codon:yes stop_codon:yes gene_type:complete
MPLPDFLINKYIDWKENVFQKKQYLYESLEKKGQRPKVFIVSCCDSRVDVNQIFASNPGDFFIHRNIANLIPDLNVNNVNHEITSSIDYAILTLKISRIIILGHSCCGGINFAFNKFSDKNKNEDDSLLNNWIQSVKSSYDKIDKSQSKIDAVRSLEKESIINSIQNLKNYKKIHKSILQNKLQIHGLFFEISTGKISEYNESSKKFEIIY